MENINRFYMIDDILSNKKFNSIINELFIRGTELNISLAFITQSYFTFPNIVRLNSTHDIIMKIPNKRELQQIIIYLILTLKALWIFTRNILTNHIPFYLLVLLFLH